MKKLSCNRLIVLGTLLLLPHAQARETQIHESNLSFRINPKTGEIIATDIWNAREQDALSKDGGHELRELEEGGFVVTDKPGNAHFRKCFLLSNAFVIRTNSTTIDGSMIITDFTLPRSNHAPLEQLWVQVSATNDDFNRAYFHYYEQLIPLRHGAWIPTDDANSILGSAYYGDWRLARGHTLKLQPASDVDIDVLKKVDTKGGETFWLLKLNYKIKLRNPINYMPNVALVLRFGLETIACDIKGNPPEATFVSLEKRIQYNERTTSGMGRTGLYSAQPKQSQPNRKDIIQTDFPDVKLSITKSEEFLLITFYPVVTNASLEQADIGNETWSWQPASTVTNIATNGWYILPTQKARVFRVRIDR